jgi:hypothetical protein
MKTLITIALLTCTLLAQERFLLRIGQDGRQEAVPLEKGEKSADAVRRIMEMPPATKSAGTIDTIKYFDEQADFSSYFPFTRGDVALQWYKTDAECVVKEFWWRNGEQNGLTGNGRIRFWKVNPRLTDPWHVSNAFLGTYKDPSADDGVTPFPPVTGNRFFYCNPNYDSLLSCIPPLSKEIELNGISGIEVPLVPNAWQHISIDEWTDSARFNPFEPFGFTIENPEKKPDFGNGSLIPMQVMAAPNTNTTKEYHSFKFYRQGRTAPWNAGWHLRGDYEWWMFVIVELVSDRAPKISVGSYNTTLSTGGRTIEADITDDNPAGGPAGIGTARLFSKVGRLSSFDSTGMSGSASSYSAVAKPAAAGDTIYWYMAATDVQGNRTVTPVRHYVIFKKCRNYLFIYNNAGFSRSNANLIYLGTSNPTGFDFWSSVSDGTSELPTLLALYNDILIVDGNFPSRNIYTALKARLASATASSPVYVMLSSQDYGCFIEANCADTTFAVGTLEYDYFGISKLGTQDLPPTNREFRIIPQPDPVTDYLIKFGTDSGSTLWHDPTFELGFAGYPDAMTMRPEAKALFKDAAVKILGGKYITSSTRSLFVGFDIGALQFRSDTSIAAGNDPKYKWVPTDVGSVASKFFQSNSIPKESGCSPSTTDVTPQQGMQFSLVQNYPNPFNPVTKIDFTLPQLSYVTITIYNVLGQSVATVLQDVLEPGAHSATFNAQSLASGIYFYELKANNYSSVKKMLLLK